MARSGLDLWKLDLWKLDLWKLDWGHLARDRLCRPAEPEEAQALLLKTPRAPQASFFYPPALLQKPVRCPVKARCPPYKACRRRGWKIQEEFVFPPPAGGSRQ